MTPYFFGCSTQQLFGVYHPPTSGPMRNKAILICPPFGHEYMRTHWAFRRLSEQLSHNGFHVLRFDYFGTGDSAGDSNEVSITQWQKDISTAAEELKEMAGIQTISIVAMRLGAALTMMNKKIKTQDLIFWEPVICGKTYLNELQNIHNKFITDFNHSSHSATSTPANEFIGQRYSDTMISELKKINGLEERPNTKNLEVIYSSPPGDKLKETIQSKDIPYQNHIIDDAGQWSVLTALGAAVLPTKTISTIVTVLTH